MTTIGQPYRFVCEGPGPSGVGCGKQMGTEPETPQECDECKARQRTPVTATPARLITQTMRLLYPVPVRLSVRSTDAPEWFRLRLPRGCGNDPEWLAGYLSRHLGRQVKINFSRTILRRDCGHDVEYTLQVIPASSTQSAQKG